MLCLFISYHTRVGLQTETKRSERDLFARVYYIRVDTSTSARLRYFVPQPSTTLAPRWMYSSYVQLTAEGCSGSCTGACRPVPLLVEVVVLGGGAAAIAVAVGMERCPPPPRRAAPAPCIESSAVTLRSCSCSLSDASSSSPFPDDSSCEREEEAESVSSEKCDWDSGASSV